MELLTIATQTVAWILAGAAAWLIAPVLRDAYLALFDSDLERFDDVDELAKRDRELGL